VRRNSAVFASQSSCILLVCIGRRLNFCSELNHAHLSAVVRGAGRAAREALEERRPGLQLHVPALRLCHPAHRLRKVPPHMPTTKQAKLLFRPVLARSVVLWASGYV
jgi:hypothetical protein